MDGLTVKAVVNLALEVGLTTKVVADMTRCTRQQVWLDRKSDGLVAQTKPERRERLVALYNDCTEAKKLGLLPLAEAVVQMNKKHGVDTIVRAQLDRAREHAKKQAIV